MAPLIWLIVGLGLLGVLAAGVDLDGLMAAGLAALVLSVLGALVPLSGAAQLLLFAGVLFVLLLGLQWWSRHRRARALPWTPSSEQAEVLSGFDASGRGRVRWQGQSWAAINLDSQHRLQPGQQVIVMGRDGTNLQIMVAPSAAERPS